MPKNYVGINAPKRLVSCECGCGTVFLTPGKCGADKRFCVGHNGALNHSVRQHLQKINENKRTPHSTLLGALGKECRKCLTWKPLTSFGPDIKRWDKVETRCRACLSAKSLAYHYRNFEKIKERKKDPTRQNKARVYRRKWRKARWENDDLWRMGRKLRTKIWKIINNAGGKKAFKTVELLGCSVVELRVHLESLFSSGMSWDNYGQPGWEIDHIRPVSSFDLTDKEQQKKCFHFSNLQPLWGIDNNHKHKKWSKV